MKFLIRETNVLKETHKYGKSYPISGQSYAAFWKDGVWENMVTPHRRYFVELIKEKHIRVQDLLLNVTVVFCNAHFKHYTWRPYQAISLINCWPSYNYHPPIATSTCQFWTCCSFNSQWIWSRQKDPHLPLSPNSINYPNTAHIPSVNGSCTNPDFFGVYSLILNTCHRVCKQIWACGLFANLSLHLFAVHGGWFIT